MQGEGERGDLSLDHESCGDDRGIDRVDRVLAEDGSSRTSIEWYAQLQEGYYLAAQESAALHRDRKGVK